MIPLALILAATAFLALVILIAARRSSNSISRAGETHSSWTYSSDFGGYDSGGADCSGASGGGDCGGGDGSGGD